MAGGVKYLHKLPDAGGYGGEFVVQIDGEVAGTVYYWRESAEMLNISMLHVWKKWQRRGLGLELLKRFKKEIRKTFPRIDYASGEVTSIGALKVMDRAYGAALMIDNGVRCIDPRDAPRWIPVDSPAADDGRIDNATYLRTVHWIGRGRRQQTDHWHDCMQDAKRDFEARR